MSHLSKLQKFVLSRATSTVTAVPEKEVELDYVYVASDNIGKKASLLEHTCMRSRESIYRQQSSGHACATDVLNLIVAAPVPQTQSY